MTDEEQIRRTLADFCRTLDQRKFVEWSETFTEDGVFMKKVGRPAILEWILEGEVALNPELNRRHTNPSVVISVNGNEADVICDLIMFDQIGTGPISIRIGKYVDRLVKHDGRWLFSDRQLSWQETTPAK